MNSRPHCNSPRDTEHSYQVQLQPTHHPPAARIDRTSRAQSSVGATVCVGGGVRSASQWRSASPSPSPPGVPVHASTADAGSNHPRSPKLGWILAGRFTFLAGRLTFENIHP